MATAISKASKRLTDKQVRALKPTGKAFMVHDGDGLYLRVGPTGSKAWTYRYRHAGKLHDIGLGSAKLRTLADARAKAKRLAVDRLDGIDPLATRMLAKRPVITLTFQQVAERWMVVHETEWTAKHRADVVSSLSAHAYKAIGHLPVAAVDTPAIMRTIEPQWLTKTETMSRVRARIEAILGYAVTAGYRPPGDNPARWNTHLENLLPAKGKVAPSEKFAKLRYEDMAGFMVELRARDGLVARALEFAILTAARTGEVIGATWAEIDLEGRLWTIPAARMKAGQEHRVPLTAPALALLEALPRDGDLVFGKLVNNSMIRLLDKFGRTGSDGRKITAHGFRGTFSNWAAENTGYSYEVREMAMAHRVGNDVERRYNTADLLAQRRRLAEDWASYCDDGQDTDAKVVTLRA